MLKPVTVILITLLFSVNKTTAQKIDLKDVAKIELIIKRNVVRVSYGDFEVVPENGVWNSYQTHFYQPYSKDMRPHADSVRRLITRAPEAMLKNLISAVNQPDSAIKYERFKVKNEDMLKYVDTFITDVKPGQRLAFVKAIQSYPLVNQLIQKSFKTNYLFRDPQYSIVITTKSKQVYSINGLAWQNLYHMPWQINGINVYQPQIAEVFEYLTGNPEYAKTEMIRLYNGVMLDVWFKKFATRFYWDDLRTDDPAVYRALNTKLPPSDHFYAPKTGWYGDIRAKRLPGFVRVVIRINKGDTATAARAGRLIDTLANASAKGCFIFDYIKQTPNALMRVPSGNLREFGLAMNPTIFESIKRIYPDAANFSFKEILPFSIEGEHRLNAECYLLPDNTVIIKTFKGTIQYNDRFTGLTPGEKEIDGWQVFNRHGIRLN